MLRIVLTTALLTGALWMSCSTTSQAASSAPCYTCSRPQGHNGWSSSGNYGRRGAYGSGLPTGRTYYNGRYYGNFNNRFYGPQYGYF